MTEEQKLFDASAAARAAQMRLRRERDDAVYAAKQAIEAEYADRMNAAARAAFDAEKALNDWRSTKTSHPDEGRRVSRREYGGKRVYGVVEVRRTKTELPKSAGYWRIPDYGEAFVRLLKNDGSPGLKFERYTSNWSLDPI